MRWRNGWKNGFLLFLAVALVAGCSSEAGDNNSHNENNKEEKAQIPKKVEDMIAQSPGKYSGSNYDQKKVEAELDQIDPNASKEEVYSTVMNLLAEDFSSLDQAFGKVDTSYGQKSKKPSTDVNKPEFDQYNVSILLDASGSMAGQVSGGEKMKVAKEAVQTFVSTFPEEAHVSLIAYGHKGSNSKKDKSQSCAAIEEIYPLDTYKKSDFNGALESVDATGWTPLADAIKKSGETLKDQKGKKNGLYRQRRTGDLRWQSGQGGKSPARGGHLRHCQHYWI